MLTGWLIFPTATLPQISHPTHSEGKLPYCSVESQGFFVDMRSPTQHGWVVEDTHIEPLWSEGPILTCRLVDILAGGQDSSEDDDASDDEPDFDAAFSSNQYDDDYNN